jgi:uncharacterized protein with PIN domain
MMIDSSAALAMLLQETDAAGACRRMRFAEIAAMTLLFKGDGFASAAVESAL